MIDVTYTVLHSDFNEAQKLYCLTELKKLPGRRVLLFVSLIFGGFTGLSFNYLPVWLQISLLVLVFLLPLAEEGNLGLPIQTKVRGPASHSMCGWTIPAIEMKRRVNVVGGSVGRLSPGGMKARGPSCSAEV